MAMVNEKVTSSSRRSFLSRVWTYLGIAAILQFLAGAVFFLGSGRKEAGRKVAEKLVAGAVADFPPGSVTLIAKGYLYLSRLDDGGFLAISRKCTHLGCAVPWIAERKQFECPCHASVFDKTGNVIKAPAPRALDLHAITFERDMVIIDLGSIIKRSDFSAEQAVYPQELG